MTDPQNPDHFLLLTLFDQLKELLQFEEEQQHHRQKIEQLHAEYDDLVRRNKDLQKQITGLREHLSQELHTHKLSEEFTPNWKRVVQESQQRLKNLDHIESEIHNWRDQAERVVQLQAQWQDLMSDPDLHTILEQFPNYTPTALVAWAQSNRQVQNEIEQLIIEKNNLQALKEYRTNRAIRDPQYLHVALRKLGVKPLIDNGVVDASYIDDLEAQLLDLCHTEFHP